jgi:hypothetical protein
MCIVISCLTSWRPEEIDVYETLRLKRKSTMKTYDKLRFGLQKLD